MARLPGRLLQMTTTALILGAVAAFLAIGIGPHLFGYRTLTVLSGSMRPTIPEGSIVVTIPVDLQDLRAGDVVTYQIPVEDHRVVTHRIVEVVETGPNPVVRTQGDANAEPDPWQAQLSGTGWRTAFSVPHAGWAISALHRSEVRQLLVTGLPAALAVLWLWSIWGRRETTREEDTAAGLAPAPIRNTDVRHVVAAGAPLLLTAVWLWSTWEGRSGTDGRRAASVGVR